MKILLCLKDQESWERALRHFACPAGADVCIAPLTEDISLVGKARAWAEANGCKVQILRSQADYRSICLRAREKLLAFTAQWPDRFRWRGRSFRELFVHRGTLSWWWLAELSQRNAEDRPTFAWLCEVELLRDLIGDQGFDLALVCLDSVDLYTVICRLLRSRGVLCIANRGRRPLLDKNRLLLVWLMRWRDFFGELVHALAVKWACRRTASPPVAPERCSVVFHSWYPLQWLRAGSEAEDRYYLNIPELVDATGKFHSSFLATLRGPISPLKIVSAVRRRKVSPEFDYVQRYCRVRDLLRCYFDFLPSLRYLVLETVNRPFRRSFIIDGIDFFTLLRHDMRFSYLRNIPRLLVVAEQFRKFAERHKPDVFVTYLELYCYGRAIIYGIKAGSPRTKVIGYQHSAITPMKLVYNYGHEELRIRNGSSSPLDYMPLPDHFAVHGAAAQRILCAGGYPPSRVDITGVARIDYLHRKLQQPPETCPETSKGYKLVLVAAPIWPERAKRLIEIAILGMRDRQDVFPIFKLHPAGSLGEPAVRSIAHRYGIEKYRVWNGDLYTLLRMASVLFTMSSTTGAEAVAMGVPVIHLQSPLDLDLSPFFEVPESAFQVTDVEQFQIALKAVLDRGEALRRCQSKWGELITQTFYAVDGRAGERFVKALDRVAFGGAPDGVNAQPAPSEAVISGGGSQ